MLLAPARPTAFPRLSRFGYLMELYAENFTRFERMFSPLDRAGRWRSSVDDGMDVHLHLLEQHRYTTLLRLSYDLRDPATGTPDPSAFLRHYRDARLIEVTHCHVGRGWRDVLGPLPGPGTLLGYRLRMNTFLGKWLDYLSGQGHSPFTLHREDDAPAAAGCARTETE